MSGGVMGIRQSVERATRLLSQTGILGASRGLETDAWRHGLHEAWRELSEAADELAGPRGARYYSAVGPDLARQLWHAILLSEDIDDGCRIVAALGNVPGLHVAVDVRETCRAMLPEHKGYPNALLGHYRDRILAASPDLGTLVERRAARAGDPPPPRLSEADVEFYGRVTLRALQLAESGSLAEEARNPKMAAFIAFMHALVMPSAESGARNAFMTHLGAESPHTFAVSALVGLGDAGDAYLRGSYPTLRLRAAIEQAALEESGGNQITAGRLTRRLVTIEEQANTWLTWVNRHRDHPAWSPPGREYRPAP